MKMGFDGSDTRELHRIIINEQTKWENQRSQGKYWKCSQNLEDGCLSHACPIFSSRFWSIRARYDMSPHRTWLGRRRMSCRFKRLRSSRKGERKREMVESLHWTLSDFRIKDNHDDGNISCRAHREREKTNFRPRTFSHFRRAENAISVQHVTTRLFLRLSPPKNSSDSKGA